MNDVISSRPCRNSERLRQRLSVVYASATREGSRMFHASSASRTFRAAVSRGNGGNGGRSMVGSLVAGGMADARITAGNRCGIQIGRASCRERGGKYV